ncbi:MAG: flagellar hook-associated protein FlgL [Arcobacter sp.]|jgi:flagellar hook-associated protein 3 FlgL|uniref:flagellar hook-associated protein FlgL n=1 Tax=Arcobacter sp. TaxID=1872629 RepID=UPI0019B2C65C|nr:flagellar hook-associated protein FlgL [Arcobacter sp.]MBD3829817.1 flagellar hook-associated protein FlgL [Arcobacter sp.]MDY3204121.1 flagellar hook-associated protein FlgL [Arcobacter sp.]
MINQTEQMMYRLNNLDTLQRKLNFQYGGKQLENGSDDSILYSRIVSVDDKIRTYEGIETQIERTVVQNNTADSSMKEIKKILEYINAELIKANTDTTGEDGLKAIAVNIAGMKENLYDLANTQVEGEYVFTGSDSSIKPFEMDANGKVTYVGDNKLRSVAVEEGSYRERGVNGFDMMMYSSSTAYKDQSLTFSATDRIIDQDGNEWKLNSPTNDTLTKYDPDGNVTTDTMAVTFDVATNTYSTPVLTAVGTKFEAKTNIFDLIDNVVNSLNKVDSAGNPISDTQARTLIGKGLEELTKAYDGVNIAHAELGSRNKIFETSLEGIGSKLTQYKKLSQDLSSSNLTEVALQAKALELTYTALYSTISKTNQLSLVNFMN